ncbi:MAG: YgiT-type zinc finger protein [Deltaproteobacteria bacterium]|nr:YgiT-type zinc finger protein [Deltaproteobacteria bacterium]
MTERSLCPLCGGQLEAGTTTFTADFGRGVVVVRHVPATLCTQCGEAWIDDRQAAKLEELVGNARRNGRAVEVIDLAA